MPDTARDVRHTLAHAGSERPRLLGRVRLERFALPDDVRTAIMDGTGDATISLADGRDVTVSCAEGDNGFVYDGILRFDEVITKLIEIHRAKKTLNEQPLHFDLAKYKDRANSPLYFPGKVLADDAGKRLFICRPIASSVEDAVALRALQPLRAVWHDGH